MLRPNIATECHHQAFTSVNNPKFTLDWIAAVRYWMDEGPAPVILLVFSASVADGQHGPPVNRPSVFEDAMFAFRAMALGLLVVALVCGAPVIRAQAPTTVWPQTTAELARDIAFTIRSNPGATRGSTVMSQDSATSHGNLVEIRYRILDAAAFARSKQDADGRRLHRTYYYCHPSRISYITRGVVIHEITASPGGDDQFDYTIDKLSCDALPPKPTRADPASLARLALSVAEAENDALKKVNVREPLFQFIGANARQGLVEERYTVATNSLASMQANRAMLRDVSVGNLCGKHRDALFQGVAVRQMFASEDGSPVFDFTIDGSDC